MTQLIIFRGVQAIGASIMMANSYIVIADLFPPSERGKFQGYMSGVYAIASVIGPTLGGFLTDSLSWHWIFFINIPLGLFILAVFIKFFPDFRPNTMRSKVDYPGLTVPILTVSSAMLALETGGSTFPWGSPQIIGLFIFAAVMLGLFIYIESRAKEPIIPLSLFKNRIVTISLMIGSSSIGFFAAITFIPLFLQGVKGASATTVVI